MAGTFTLTPPVLDPPEDSEDCFKNDKLERAEFAGHLKRLVEHVEGPAVLVLDAPWGAGKTHFVKMWQCLLRKEGFPVIYFDAFKNDYQDDAFVALAAELSAFAEEHLPKDEAANTRLTAFRNSAVTLGKVLFRLSAAGITKAALGNAISAETVGDFVEQVTEEVAKAGASELDKALKAKFERHSEDRDAFKTFGEQLNLLVPESLLRNHVLRLRFSAQNNLAAFDTFKLK